MAISATSSGLGTPSAQFLSFMQMNQDSKALKSSVRTARSIEKNMQKESDKAAKDMTKFFSSIGKDIKMLVKKSADSLGITTLMAKIMGKDLALSEKKGRRQKIKDRGTNIEDAQTKDQKEKGPGMIATLKEKFEDVTIGEKLKALLLIGAVLLLTKIQKTLVPIVKALIKAFVFVKDKVFGNFESPGGATFAALLAGIVAWKFRGFIKLIGSAALSIGSALLSVTRFLGINKLVAARYKAMSVLMMKQFKGKGAFASIGKIWRKGGPIGLAFAGIRKASLLIFSGAKGALKALGGGMSKLFSSLGKVFTLMRLGILAMYTSMIPIVAPLLPIIGIIAGIVLVLASLKSGFDTFKQSLDDGDSMFTAVLKGLGDAMLTLVTLPLTLVKKLAGWIAGLLGLDSFKEELDKFNFKAFVKNTFKSLITGLANFVKAVALGAVAAFKALGPGGESPLGAFSKTYNEVMSGGEGTTASAGEGSTASKEPTLSDLAMTQGFTETKETLQVNNTMKEKNKEIIRLAAIKGSGSSGPVTIISNKGNTDASVKNNNAFLHSPVNVSHSDSAARQLSEIF